LVVGSCIPQKLYTLTDGNWRKNYKPIKIKGCNSSQKSQKTSRLSGHQGHFLLPQKIKLHCWTELRNSMVGFYDDN